MMSSTPSNKRSIDLEGNAVEKSARRKIHPFFTKPAIDESPSAFRWIQPALGPKRSCLHGVNLEPKSEAKVAAFDLDGTLIKSNGAARNDTTWEWWRKVVPVKLKEVHDAGYSVVVISNQAIKPGKLEPWKQKIALISAALPEVSFRIFAATSKDGHRKPMPGMWLELERIFRSDNVCIDKTASFFVGDAAGRPADFAATDRKWAANVGIPFFTPEEYFLQLPAVSYKLPGFQVTSLPDLPLFTPTSTPLVPPATGKPELVLFVGYPCLGKSTLFLRHFQPNGYEHVNQDTLGSRGKCVKAAEQALSAGRSCVVDNTNRDARTRKYYIDLARRFGAPVRCCIFSGSIELAWHNNLYRAYNMPASTANPEPRRQALPYIAFTGFRDNYEVPQLEEGFAEIKTVNWVFEGTDEEKVFWSMWLQIDGK